VPNGCEWQRQQSEAAVSGVDAARETVQPAGQQGHDGGAGQVLFRTDRAGAGQGLVILGQQQCPNNVGDRYHTVAVLLIAIPQFGELSAELAQPSRGSTGVLVNQQQFPGAQTLIQAGELHQEGILLLQQGCGLAVQVHRPEQ